MTDQKLTSMSSFNIVKNKNKKQTIPKTDTQKQKNSTNIIIYVALSGLFSISRNINFKYFSHHNSSALDNSYLEI